MADVKTDLTRDTVSATATVDAAPEEVFDYLRRPANHGEINGDGTVTGTLKGPERLAEGDRFGMSMKLGLPYRITSKVVEYEDGRRLAWAHPAGHRWRWEVAPAGEGRSTVTETYDLSTNKATPLFRLFGFPKKQQDNVAASVANVVAHFAHSGG